MLSFPSVPRISSRQNPIVGRFRDAARGTAPGAILLEGAHLLADALDAGVQIEVAAVSAEAEGRAGTADLLRRLDRAGVEVAPVTAAVAEALSPVRSASGVVALARRPETDPRRVFASASPLVVVAADVQDPGNLGAIVRVAEAAGASGVIGTASGADPFGWKALRGSMGSALRLPVARMPSTPDAVAAARVAGCRIVATVPRGGRAPSEAGLSGPAAILIGGEGPGLPDAVVDEADERVTIPMAPPVESLNAAVTAALMLYEARRQRARG